MTIVAYVKAAFATVIILASMAVNLSVIVVTTRSPRLRNDLVTQVMRSLAVSDILLGAGVLVVSSLIVWIFHGADSVVIPLAVSTFHGFLLHLYAINCFVHVALAAVIKCCVVVRPLDYADVISERTVARTLAAVWVIDVTVGAVELAAGLRFTFDWDFIMPRIVDGRFVVSPVDLVVFLASTACLVVSYLRIFLVVRKQLNVIGPVNRVEVVVSNGTVDTQIILSSSSSRQWHSLQLASVRSAKIIFIISGTFLLTFTPMVVKTFIADTAVWFTFAAKWIHLLGSVTNGLLYVVLHRSVRRELKKIFWQRATVLPPD